jgi:hypothetical protein
LGEEFFGDGKSAFCPIADAPDFLGEKPDFLAARQALFEPAASCFGL